MRAQEGEGFYPLYHNILINLHPSFSPKLFTEAALSPTAQNSDLYFCYFFSSSSSYITMLYAFTAKIKLRTFGRSCNFPARTYKFCLVTGDILIYRIWWMYTLTTEIHDSGKQYRQRHTIVYNSKLGKVLFNFAADVPTYLIGSGYVDGDRDIYGCSSGVRRDCWEYPRAPQTECCSIN